MTDAHHSIRPLLFRDLADGIQQQMYFWGQDVLRPEGNFLVAQGFARSPSTGLPGTSCYRRAWQGGHIELYGSCAGWYGARGGFTFIRPWKRCARWKDGATTPIPGSWQRELIDFTTSGADLYAASLPFLDWLISHEFAVLSRFGRAYRQNTYWKYSKIPKAKAWLPPQAALQWFQAYREQPDQLPRPKQLLIASHG
ncbi:hypothetical protein [Roseibacillus ishigakijimensis]|uniref:Uncharacterized protein n=1 Tax=Roseibacillus ishigakijimensis TaxID=454146 RepID=A0A934VIA1_9BACT|nr:hypothetical protein [Roseibacillus ishigakijimensis]MBK1834858.1 hypothetical protein [Roseibacillus ishigakijimensis]